MSSQLPGLSAVELFRGAAPWAGAVAAAVRSSFSAEHAARPLRVSCSTAAAGASASDGGVFSGRDDRAEHVVMSRGLFLDHFDALGRDRFLSGASDEADALKPAFFYLAQGEESREDVVRYVAGAP